jgi:hypothetical protein
MNLSCRLLVAVARISSLDRPLVDRLAFTVSACVRTTEEWIDEVPSKLCERSTSYLNVANVLDSFNY